MTGIFLIDKPTGISSYDVLRILKKNFQEKQMGYLGTLDPLATGLLIIFVGKATKLIPYCSNFEKVYQVELELGKVSDTYDSTGEIKAVDSFSFPSDENLETAFQSFLGTQWQIQPSFSAIKFKGKRAYEHARSGKKFDLGKRQVSFFEITLLKKHFPFLALEVKCSGGTYIRSFVHELGTKLQTGAIMTKLRRIQVGPFSVDQGQHPETVGEDQSISIREFIVKYLDFSSTAKGEKAYLLKKFGY